MRKTFIIARREYLAAVKSKAFLLSLVLMPLLMFGGIIVQSQTRKLADTTTYKVAVLDRTPGAKLADVIVQAAKTRNEKEVFADGVQTKPKFEIEVIAPAPASDAAAIATQRFELSERSRKKDLLAFIEIGQDVTGSPVLGLAKAAAARSSSSTEPTSGLSGDNPLAALQFLESMPDEYVIRYSSNQPSLMAFRSWLQRTLGKPIYEQRMVAAGVNQLQVAMIGQLLIPPVVADRGLARKTADGAITFDADKAGIIETLIVPIVLGMLLFVMVIVGCSPLATNIIEEKQLRIAEVLLGGVSPFELMLGKLLGGVGVALTLAAVYFAGLIVAAQRMDAMQYVRMDLMIWFVAFTVMAVLLYGSLFVAAGAAVSNLKEVQSIITPIMLFVAMPFFVMQPVLEFPNGAIAKTLTYFPLSSPAISIMRAAIPAGAQWWELTLALVVGLAATLGIVWIAGRIFRVGMLMNSRPASFGELVRWVVKG